MPLIFTLVDEYETAARSDAGYGVSKRSPSTICYGRQFFDVKENRTYVSCANSHPRQHPYREQAAGARGGAIIDAGLAPHP